MNDVLKDSNIFSQLNKLEDISVKIIEKESLKDIKVYYKNDIIALQKIYGNDSWEYLLKHRNFNVFEFLIQHYNKDFFFLLSKLITSVKCSFEYCEFLSFLFEKVLNADKRYLSQIIKIINNFDLKIKSHKLSESYFNMTSYFAITLEYSKTNIRNEINLDFNNLDHTLILLKLCLNMFKDIDSYTSLKGEYHK
jgi:hypothetical protein